MPDFKSRLEKYIEAEVRRRVEQRLSKLLDEIGAKPAAPNRRRAGKHTDAAAKRLVSKPRRPVSAETRAKMKAAWARRRAAANLSDPTKDQ